MLSGRTEQSNSETGGLDLSGGLLLLVGGKGPMWWNSETGVGLSPLR